MAKKKPATRKMAKKRPATRKMTKKPGLNTMQIVPVQDNLPATFVNYATVVCSDADSHVVLYQVLPGSKGSQAGSDKMGAVPVVRLSTSTQFLRRLSDAILRQLALIEKRV